MNDTVRILVIDDDKQIRDTAVLLLRDEFPDARIVPIADRAGLTRALEANDFDLVITDYQIGWTDGLAILHQVKSRNPDCPVIMFTGTGSEEIAVEAMKSGLEDYVLKSPAHIKRLAASVRMVLKQVAQRRHLRDKEARERSILNDVLDTSAVGLFILDANLRVAWVNSALEQYFGMRREALVGQDKRRLIHEHIKHRFADPDEFARKILQAYERNDRELRFECHILAADGCEERWLEHRSQPIRSGLYAGGRIEHYCDITERKRVEATVRAIEERFELAVKATHDSIWDWNLETQAVWWDESSKSQYGYRPEDIQPTLAAWEGRIHPDDRDGVLASIYDAIEHGKMYWSQEYRFRCADGSYANVLDRGYVIRNEKGAPIRMVGAMLNISERKQAEDHLRATNDTLSSLIRAAPLGITILDADGRARLWNPAAEQIFGWTEAEILGHPLPIVPPEKQDEHRAFRERVLQDQSFTGIEATRRKKDGATIHISLSTAPMRDPAGRITGVMGIMADITARKQMELHAARIERMAALGQLLGGIAHELKNPLFVLAGRLELAKEKCAACDYATLPSDLDKIEEAAKRMMHVAERFLTIAKPVQPQRTSCAIPAIVQQTLEFLANELMKHRIQVVTELPADLPVIVSDSRLLQEAFLNLMLNAMQAMAEAHGRGTLTVKAEPSAVGAQPSAPAERWIEVRIQDDGPGIPPEHRAKLFEPFFSTKPAGEGTGLGLWTVRTIVTAMNGQVACETQVGQGATFLVRLPVRE